jgi:hypothetical protein
MGLFILRLVIYPFSALLAAMLWAFRWKARTLILHLNVFQPPLPYRTWFHRELFLLSWNFNLSLDLVRFLVGRYGKPIRMRPRDAKRLQELRSAPSLFLTAHFHHWEALSGWLIRNQVPVVGAARKLQHSLAQRLLVLLRGRMGVQVVDENVLPFALQHLGSGKCFGLLWDQYSPHHRHQSVFFGLPAAMNPLPEILVRRCRPRVWVGFLLPDGTFRLAAIQSSKMAARSPHILSRRYHRILELVISRHPAYWYGLCHARFKGSLPYLPGRNRSQSFISPDSVFIDLVSRETCIASKGGGMDSSDTKTMHAG